MQKIVPNLWFAGNAKQAVEFYIEAFGNDSKVTEIQNYPNSAEEGLADFQKDMAGKPLVVEFELCGYHFTAINADASFKPTAASSFMLNFDPSRDSDAEQHLNELWDKLSDGGQVLMELGEYPYSKRYGWVQDRYGFSWQLILTDPDGEPRPFIIPALMFGGPVQNRAQEAIKYYTSVFKDSKQGDVAPYGEDTGPAKAASVMFADFMLEGQWFAAMDSGVEQDFTFNEAISFLVNCKDQAEIDELWDKLSHVPESEQCGWCKDQFGVSWQIAPANMNELVTRPGGFAKMMQMHKIEIDKF